jgi:hypothetical protein
MARRVLQPRQWVFFGTAGDGTNQYGVYGTTANGLADTSGTTKWAGYFVGDVAVARLFNFSDGKLKSNIQPIEKCLGKFIENSSYYIRFLNVQNIQLYHYHKANN